MAKMTAEVCVLWEKPKAEEGEVRWAAGTWASYSGPSSFYPCSSQY